MDNENEQEAVVERPSDLEKLHGVARYQAAQELYGLAKHKARKEAWNERVNYLAFLVQWDTMFTITNREAGWTCEAMEKKFKRWMHGFPGVPTMYAFGLHPGGHGAHCHGTMRLAARGVLRKTIGESSTEHFGRSEFKRVRNIGAVVGYINKAACGEALKHGNWGLIGVCQNFRKLGHLLERRQVPITGATCTGDVVTVQDVIEGNLGLPGPELELDLKEQVNLWK